MKIKNRQQLLTAGAIAVVALFAADKLLLKPLTGLWKQRATRVAELRSRAASGANMVKRERTLRGAWEHMRTNTLPNNPSLAEQQVLKAFDRWSRESRISVTSISPQWKHESDDFITLQCRVEAAGNLQTVSRFLYDIEKDPMALKLESVEISSRDADGQQLALGLQISGLVLTPQEQRQ
ncbi:MAG: Pilus assembly protein PilO [Verrucomicrobiota bacterium]